MNNKTFLIYNDAGVSKSSAEQWAVRCEDWGVSFRIINADDVIDGALKTGNVFIIPGGADLPYCQKLSGRGTDNIKDFVNNGGIYIGTCAGAYFAHSDIAWDNCGEIIYGKRDLAFFNGTATGPLEKPYHPETSAGLVYVPVYFSDNNDTKAMAYYKGGAVIYVDDTTTVHAKFVYKGKNYPAIASKQIGTGKAIAMSPHMEFSDDYLDSISAPKCDNRNNMFLDIFEAILFND